MIHGVCSGYSDQAQRSPIDPGFHPAFVTLPADDLLQGSWPGMLLSMKTSNPFQGQVGLGPSWHPPWHWSLPSGPGVPVLLSSAPDYFLLRHLVQDIFVDLSGKRGVVRVGKGPRSGVLVGTRRQIVSGSIHRLSCSACPTNPCVHRLALSLAQQAWMEKKVSYDSSVDSSRFHALVDNIESFNSGEWALDIQRARTLGVGAVAHRVPGGDSENSSAKRAWSALQRAVARQDTSLAGLQQRNVAVHQSLNAFLMSFSGREQVSLDGQPFRGIYSDWEGQLRWLLDPGVGLCALWDMPFDGYLPWAGGLVSDGLGRLFRLTPSQQSKMLFLRGAPSLIIPPADVADFLDSPTGRSWVSTPKICRGTVSEIRLNPTETDDGAWHFTHRGQRMMWDASPFLCLDVDEDKGTFSVHERDISHELAMESNLAGADWVRRPMSSFGQEHLTIRQPNEKGIGTGTLIPSVQASVHGHRLSVKVRFNVPDIGEEIAPARVLAAWKRGAQSVVTKSGPVSIPNAWLERYGTLTHDVIVLQELHRSDLPAALLMARPELKDFLPDGVGRLDAADAPTVDHAEPGLALEGLEADLRGYQSRGVQWMLHLDARGLGGILADDMGLGKTVQGIAYFVHVKNCQMAVGPHLVVAPTSVLGNWSEELRRFAPHLKVQSYYGPKRSLALEGVDVCLTSYGVLRRDGGPLSGIAWHSVLLDEAQMVKTPKSQGARAARRLKAKCRFALTGTPFENRLTELWSVINFSLPGYLGRIQSFKRHFSTIESSPNGQAARLKMALLRRLMTPFLLRRMKEDVVEELPRRVVEVVTVQLSETERTVYKNLESSYRKRVAYRMATVGYERAKFMMLEALLRLRQAACDLSLLPDMEFGISAKRAALLKLLVAQIREGRRFLVFSQWTSLLGRVRDDLVGQNIPFLYLDGQTKGRVNLQKTWNRSDGPPVFLISLKAGGTGMNLIGADTVVHLDPWWNPAVEAQAMDRAYRIGQTRDVRVYRLVTDDTVEARVLKTQGRKKAIFDALFDEGLEGQTSLGRRDLETLFGGEMPDLNQVDFKESKDTRPREEGLSGGSLPDVIEDLLKVHGQLTNHSVRTALDCSSYTARRHLKAWAKAGLLIRRGRRQNTRYLLA